MDEFVITWDALVTWWPEAAEEIFDYVDSQDIDRNKVKLSTGMDGEMLIVCFPDGEVFRYLKD